MPNIPHSCAATTQLGTHHTVTRDGHWHLYNVDLSTDTPVFIAGDHNDHHHTVTGWGVVCWHSRTEGIPDHAVDDAVILIQELVATGTACKGSGGQRTGKETF